MIKLTKMVDHDYDSYAGVETDKDYFPEGFINWEVPFNHFACKTAVVIMDTIGLGVDIYYDDASSELSIAWNKQCRLDESIEWLKNAPDILDAAFMEKSGFEISNEHLAVHPKKVDSEYADKRHIS